MTKHQAQLITQVMDKHNRATNIHQSSPQLSQQPLVTIARDPGSGGHPIAKLVAEKLNFAFYDDALVEEIAKSIKKRKEIVAGIDEKTRSAMQDILHSFLNPEYVSDLTYIKHLVSIVVGLAHKGRVVILGRGANFIVPASDGLHVFITAPKKIRVERAIAYEGHNRQQAVSIVEKFTAERRKFVSQYFNKDYMNPIYYDLIINTRFFDVQSSADIILAAFRHKFPTLKLNLKTHQKQPRPTWNLYSQT